MTRFEAIIIGAGPAGTAAAIGLARQGRQVAIIERAEYPRRKVCGEFTSAINIDLLDTLGVGRAFRDQAGPPVERVAFFGSGPSIEAPMPKSAMTTFGRALGRDVLDGLLLDAAQAAGATVFQPWRALGIAKTGEGSTVQVANKCEQLDLWAPVVIAAHGSWEQGKLATNLAKTNRPDDFLGFKNHFSNARLARNLMPMIAFRGGYGGMVWSDNERLSLSFCIRRSALAIVRSAAPGSSAAEAAFAHILQSCPGVVEALGTASPCGDWLAAGPIRPGLRSGYADDVFRVGNVAGESHPIIAEGIAMALQSGWMLADQLGQFDRWDRMARVAAGTSYSRAWRSQFATRIRLASLLSKLAISPPSAALMRLVIGCFPASLSLGASLSGKTKAIPVTMSGSL